MILEPAIVDLHEERVTVAVAQTTPKCPQVNQEEVSVIEERHEITSTEELGRWYNKQYRAMGQCWQTPPEEIKQHLDFIPVEDDWEQVRLNKRRAPRMLLDVGCGDGTFLWWAQQRCVCQGIEISHQAIAYGNEKWDRRVNIYLLSIEDMQGQSMYDYITAMGSLEHVVDINRALRNIHSMLRRDGRWYFFMPNERWVHTDQVNERKGTEQSWKSLFGSMGLRTLRTKEWGDSTAFVGDKI